MLPRVSLILVAVLVSIWQADGQPLSQRSLLVGVGAYPPASGWHPTSAVNDLTLLRAALECQGFEVTTLYDEQATYEGMVSALKTAAQEVESGSLFHFHFSGHGQQVPDQNGDEFDGLDEALAPYDARRTFEAGQYEGERHLTDDELGALLRDIRRAIGPKGQVFVSLDACHSGTATRGQAPVRGTHRALVPTDWSQVDLRQPEPILDWVQDAELAPMVVFSATSPRELNWEMLAADGKRYGALSYNLARVLMDLPSGRVTYQGVFDRIRPRMAVSAPRQRPQAEGALEHPFLQQGARSPRLPHLSVQMVGNERELQLTGGLLQALHPGSRLAFFPPDTQPGEGEPFAQGTLVHSELVHSYALLDSPAPVDALASAWVYVTAYASSEFPTHIRLDLAQDTALRNILMEQLSQLPFIGLEEDKASLWVELNEEEELQLWSHDEELLVRLPRSRSRFSDAAYLREQVRRYAQAQYWRNLEHDDPWLQARLHLVPLEAPLEPGEGIWRLKEGTRFYLEVENTGPKACYVQLFNIQANHDLVALAPGRAGEYTPADYRLEPGERRRLKAESGTDYWVAAGPPGVDVLKLLLTDEPVDARPALRGQTTPGTEAPWSRWLRLPARRGEPALLPGGSAGLLTAVLEVY